MVNVDENKTDKEYRILVVDDSKPIRIVMCQALRKLGYQVTEAADGEEAYGAILREKIQLIISDWIMPKMDGPALCRKLREENLGYYIYFILVSVRDSNAELVEGMDAGADDFMSKPIDVNELRARLHAGERVLRLEASLDERNRRLSEAYDQIKEDLNAAARIQRSFLPDGSLKLETVEFEWCFVPSLFVSGDELNFFRLDEDHVGFYNLDVAGHGVQAAMMSVTLSRMFSLGGAGGLLKEAFGDTPHYRINSPSKVASELNRQFQLTPENSMFFTMVYGVLNVQTGHVRLTQAGHTNPILVSKDGETRILTNGFPPIGIIVDPQYENAEFSLLPGDRLFVYTDGVTECEDDEGKQFGEARLQDFLSDSKKFPLNDVLPALENNLRSWLSVDAKGFQDDVSMIAIQYR